METKFRYLNDSFLFIALSCLLTLKVIDFIFFIWSKNNVPFRSRFLYFCEIHKFQNLRRHHRHCCIMEVTLLLSWILSTIKIKLGQIRVYLLTNISNMFLAQCWRLEASSRPFYDFNETTIKQVLSFNSWYFLSVIFNSPLLTLSKK